MGLLTEGLDTEQIIELASTRPEYVWHWGTALNRVEANNFAEENGLIIYWDAPIRPGDIYIAKRNTGWNIYTARSLGDAFIISMEFGYPYDFNECVKVEGV